MGIEDDRCKCGYYFDDDEFPTHFLLSVSDVGELAKTLAVLPGKIEGDSLEPRFRNRIEGDSEWVNKCPKCGRLLITMVENGVDLIDVYSHEATEEVDYPEPLSTSGDEFLSAVSEGLAVAGYLRVLIRYPRQGGNSDFFIVRNQSDLGNLIARARQAWAFSADTDLDRYKVGTSSPEFNEKASALLEANKELWVWHVEARLGPLTNPVKVVDRQELISAIASNQDGEVLVGAAFRLNARSTFTAYVPDADGVVKPSAY